MKKIEVIISCSVKFHAFNLAEQLDKHGMLAQLYTSYSSIKNPLAKYLVSRRDKENIPKNKISTFLLIAVGLKVYKNPYFWNELFDRWVAWKIKRSKATVFIGWSGMSLHSLRAAKKKGMTTILERGSSHISYQDKILNEEYKKFGINFNISQKVINKELSEYQLSSIISLPSYFTKESFINNGISENKLFVNNYGTSDYFNSKSTDISKNKNKFIILYLGALTIQKGLIYFFEAVKKISIPHDLFEVWLIGTISPEIKKIIPNYQNENWKIFGQINHYHLKNYIQSCDVAIQPSNQEGLSMVIPQVLKCGIPVIATTNTGGEDIIIENKSGFIVPIRNPQAIAEKIQFLYDNPTKLAEMKHFITNNPIDLSWDAYGERYRAAILNII